MRYKTALTETEIGSLALRFHCIENLDRAIDEMFGELESRGAGDLLEELCPYFGTLWPSARVLARWVWNAGAAEFSGKKVLELGCGLALPSFVAARLGATVVASDVHPDVPVFLAKNLAANVGCQIAYRRVDWREGRSLPEVFRYDWILASDVLYEKYQAASLIDFLRGHLSHQGQAILLDPDRSYWNRLVVLGRQAGFRIQTETLAPQDATDPRQAVLIRIAR